MTCLVCRAENPPGARFCGACGASIDAACPQCAAPLQAGRRFCNGCGLDLSAPAAGVPDEGERRHATVMFSDLSGYTALNEAADPEEVELFMSRIKAEAMAVIERHGGTVNQFVGDEIMALFGLPLARRDDPRHAVAAALALHRAVDAVIAASSIGQRLAMHTGIGTGLVVARRSDSRAGHYALTGDTVNTAARLRGLAPPGDIVVSAETWQQVADCFEAEATAPVSVKGKERPLVSYRICGERASPPRDTGPLVGREEELEDFAARARACAERQRSGVIVVRGDPGVGKSRLVAAFGREAETLGFSVHSAVVLDFGAETGRDAVRTLVRSLLGVADSADEAQRGGAVARVSVEWGLQADQQVSLCDLAGVPPPPALRALAGAMSITARDKGSPRILCDLVSRASAPAPLLLLVEDIHWADAWTLQCLSALALLAARHPLLLVMTTRFAGDPSAGAWRAALHGAPLLGIDLGPLSTEAATRLALSAPARSPELVTSCVERAEGNPLFLLQLLLNAEGVVQAHLPGSIQALVHARMDRLAAGDKLALQAAAVLGQRFTPDALRHLIESPSYDLKLLVEHFLVRADGPDFMFCHALIRDGAYASLLHSRRRGLHMRAASWFEDHDPLLVAEHYDRAEDRRAAHAYLEASDASAAQYRYATALILAERGLALAAERDARFALLMARSRLLVELGRAGDAIDACRAALEAAADPRERAQALIAMAAGMRLNDRIDDGLAALDEAEPLAATAGMSLELSRLHHLRGNLFFPLARSAECLREHELARQHARAAGSLEAEAAALGGLGDAYYLHGHMRSAHRQFRDCVALARKNGLGRLEVANLPMVGWTLQHHNDWSGAVAVGLEAIELAVRAAQPRAELLARSLVAWVDGTNRGHHAAAELQVEAGLRLVDILGARRFEAQLRGLSAVMAWRSGERERARHQADAALAVCREHGMGHIGPWVLGVSALVEADAAKRRLLLAEGDAWLRRGCVSHNHIYFRDVAIEVSLELGDWSTVERYCAEIQEYTAADPLPMSDFIAGRGVALSRYGRGERSVELAVRLEELRELAQSFGPNAALAAIESAAAGCRAQASRPASG